MNQENTSLVIQRDVNTSPSVLQPYANGLIHEHISQVQMYMNYLTLSAEQSIPLSSETLSVLETYLKTMLEFLTQLHKVALYAQKETSNTSTEEPAGE